MLNVRTQRRSLIRKYVAVAVLCLFALRGLSFIGMAAAMAGPNADNPVFAQIVLGDHCARAQDRSDAPAKQRAHSEHCVLCGSLARDAVALSVLILTDAFVRTPHVNVLSTPPINDIFLLTLAPGLIANWSATSPPRAALRS